MSQSFAQNRAIFGCRLDDQAINEKICWILQNYSNQPKNVKKVPKYTNFCSCIVEA